MYELKDHRDNTINILIKCYTAAQLSFMDNIDEYKVKTSPKYLPVRVDSWPAILRYKKLQQKKPYRVMYIRLDEIRSLFKKRTGKSLDVSHIIY